MENKKKWTWKLPKNIPKGPLKKDQLLIILLVGILLLVIAIPSGTGSKEKSKENQDTVGQSNTGSDSNNSYVSSMEQHLEEVLAQMSGVGKVTVMITLKTSAEKVVEKDLETTDETSAEADSQGGARNTSNTSHGEATVYEGGTQNQGMPYISKEISPQVEGVVVLASGGDNAVVVKNITEAVQALFSIDTHKIKIMKKN